jgi:hypothetical protein
MFGVLPVVFASDAIVAVGRLREVTIVIVFPLPLALVIGLGLLSRLRGPGVARDIRARMIATIIVTLGYHLGHFTSPRARPTFGPVAAADWVWA